MGTCNVLFMLLISACVGLQFQRFTLHMLIHKNQLSWLTELWSKSLARHVLNPKP